MRWPWQPEKRNRVYTDAIVTALLSRAAGTTKGNPSALSGLEISAGLWSRALSTARVEPTDLVTRVVSPAFLSAVGRALIRHGESLWAISVNEGRVVLTPACSWDITGGSDPAGWRYSLELAGPSGSETVNLPSEAVLHFQFGSDPDRPWVGTSPLGFAASSAASAAGLEQRLSEELGGPVAHLLPIPQDGGDGSDDDPLAQLKADIAGAKGCTVLLETTSAGLGEGRAAAPASDWTPKRLGAAPPDVIAKLRAEGAAGVISACGVPPSLATANSDGTAQREGYRRFVATSVRPKAFEIAAELSEKLEREITFNFDELRADDLVGRARVVKSLTDSGFSIEDAAKAALFLGAG